MSTTPSTEAPPSVGELVAHLSEQTSTLVRQELALAKAEMTQKGKAAGLGVGLFGGAGVFVLYGVGALVAAAIMGLAVAVPGTPPMFGISASLFAGSRSADDLAALAAALRALADDLAERPDQSLRKARR